MKLGLALFALLLVALVWLRWDEDPPDLSDLLPRERTNAAAQARWSELREKINATHEALDTLRQNRAEALARDLPAYRRVGPENWPDPNDTDFIRMRHARDLPLAALEAYTREVRPLLDACDALLTGEPLECPLPASFDDMPPLRMSEIVFARSMLVAWHARRDDLDGALRHIEQSLRLVAALESAGGDSVVLVTAHHTRAAALRDLELVAETSDARPGARALIAAAAEKSRPDPEPYRELLRVELHRSLLLIDETLRGEFMREESGPYVEPPAALLAIQRLFLRPNETRRMMAAPARYGIDLMERPYPERVDYDEFLPRLYIASGIPCLPNIQGRRVVNIGSFVASISAQLYAKHQTRVSAFQTWLALRAYHREHGEFPQTLPALVPSFLDAVPTDYLKRAPIGYDPERRVVWSRIGGPRDRFSTTLMARGKDTAFWLAPEAEPELTRPENDSF